MFGHGSGDFNRNVATKIVEIPRNPTPERKKKQEILISCATVYGERAAQERSSCGFLRLVSTVPAEYSLVNLQRRNFHVLGSCAAGCRFLRNTL